jgi:hypothetical protein
VNESNESHSFNAQIFISVSFVDLTLYNRRQFMALIELKPGDAAIALPEGVEPPRIENIMFPHGLKLAKMGEKFVWVPATLEEKEQFIAGSHPCGEYELYESTTCQFRDPSFPGLGCRGGCTGHKSCSHVYDAWGYWGCVCTSPYP